VAESSDSPEVQAFMAAFQKLRNLIDDDPELLEREALENPRLAKLCSELDFAAGRLRKAERNRRQLFSAPSNPAFVDAWRDYEHRYSAPVSRIELWTWLGVLLNDPPADRDEGFERRWKYADDDARSNA
jgi:hypothetical protein